MFQKKPQDISITNKVDLNVLHYIVIFNDDEISIEMLRTLDSKQLNKNIINQQDNNYKHAPLHLVAIWNKHKAIRWLCEHGANASLKDVAGRRPYEYSDEETRRIILQYKTRSIILQYKT